MRKIFHTVTLVAALFLSGTAFADQILTERTLDNFLLSMTEVKTLSENMSAEGRAELEKYQNNQMMDSEFTPYSHAVGVLKVKYPGDYTSLYGVVTQHGFGSPEEWANAGDDIMAAYMNVKVGDQMRQAATMMSSMPAETMAMMPPQAKQQMERSKSMVKALDAVPAENTALLTKHADRMDSVMEGMAN
jgi:hypothetical protein